MGRSMCVSRCAHCQKHWISGDVVTDICSTCLRKGHNPRFPHEKCQKCAEEHGERVTAYHNHTMKALTLWQPWATFVAHGIKTIETRSWDTSYRGFLAIHAAQSIPGDVVRLCSKEPFAEWIERLGYQVATLPLGKVVCKAQLNSTFETGAQSVSDFERQFGDFSEGRFGWVFTSVIRYLHPIPARGHQRLWDWWEPEDVVADTPFDAKTKQFFSTTRRSRPSSSKLYQYPIYDGPDVGLCPPVAKTKTLALGNVFAPVACQRSTKMILHETSPFAFPVQF